MHSTASTAHLDQDARAALARELDDLGAEVRADLGAADAAYVRAVIKGQRHLEAAGRLLLLGARYKPALLAGTAALTLSKVIENMELGHNVMHGQWDWMQDPAVHSTTWEWDAASTARSWKHAHNFQHHTYTNVVGKDRDLGYSAMRVDPVQPWHPVYLLQPIYGVLMALTFEWGIALYDMELDAVRRGEKSRAVAREELRGFADKALTQLGKDFALFPALAGRKGFRSALLASLTANLVRNVWVHTVVFMGHLPEPADTFTQEQYEVETRGDWYVRQLAGSCNLEGTQAFHFLTGNLSHQIEHHLFPDIPSSRYARLAPRVKEICERYGLPYHSGRLGRQYRSVARKVLRLSLPGGQRAAVPVAEPAPREVPVPAFA